MNRSNCHYPFLVVGIYPETNSRTKTERLKKIKLLSLGA
jgi:hypothetical protein